MGAVQAAWATLSAAQYKGAQLLCLDGLFCNAYAAYQAFGLIRAKLVRQLIIIATKGVKCQGLDWLRLMESTMESTTEIASRDR